MSSCTIHSQHPPEGPSHERTQDPLTMALTIALDNVCPKIPFRHPARYPSHHLYNDRLRCRWRLLSGKYGWESVTYGFEAAILAEKGKIGHCRGNLGRGRQRHRFGAPIVGRKGKRTDLDKQ
jgi:hypothetical protein